MAVIRTTINITVSASYQAMRSMVTQLSSDLVKGTPGRKFKVPKGKQSFDKYVGNRLKEYARPAIRAMKERVRAGMPNSRGVILSACRVVNYTTFKARTIQGVFGPGVSMGIFDLRIANKNKLKKPVGDLRYVWEIQNVGMRSYVMSAKQTGAYFRNMDRGDKWGVSSRKHKGIRPPKQKPVMVNGKIRLVNRGIYPVRFIEKGYSTIIDLVNKNSPLFVTRYITHIIPGFHSFVTTLSGDPTTRVAEF